jgi:hypothetical protein
MEKIKKKKPKKRPKKKSKKMMMEESLLKELEFHKLELLYHNVVKYVMVLSSLVDQYGTNPFIV